MDEKGQTFPVKKNLHYRYLISFILHSYHTQHSIILLNLIMYRIYISIEFVNQFFINYLLTGYPAFSITAMISSSAIALSISTVTIPLFRLTDADAPSMECTASITLFTQC